MTIRDLVIRLRDEAAAKIYVVATGGGAGLQRMLWSVPGASSFLAGASFPYATFAIDDVLGFTPAQYCSEETAVALATAAYLRAGATDDAIGLGVTAKVATLVPHRGPPHLFAATLSRRACTVYSVELESGAGEAPRERDGERADHLGLVALLDAAGIPSDELGPLVGRYSALDASALARQELFARPLFRATGAREASPDHMTLAFPGTFDPPHAGHFGMARAAASVTGFDPVFWITAEPPHKAAVPVGELLGRARLLRGHDVFFTKGEPLYIDKARRYPGCRFLVGTDALLRLLDPKWGPVAGALVAELRLLHTRFYVASRVIDGKLVTLSDVPGAPLDLCIELDGRWDVSSTELRQSQRP